MTKEEIIKKNREIKKLFYFLKGGIIVAENKKTAKNFNELTNLFEDVNQKYDYSKNDKQKYNTSISLKQLDNVELNNDDIEKLAKDSLREYYSANVNSIKSKNKNAIDNLNDSIELQTQNANNLKENINKTIEDVKQNASNDALKRGLARSSIIINKLNAFDNAKIEEYNKIDKELTNSVYKINNEINELNKEKEDALNEFNITYASKLNEKINSLTKELTEKQEEITKYNNEIKQIEAKYEKENQLANNNLEQQEFDNYLKLSDFLANYGQTALNNVKNNEKYEYAFDYFSSISSKDANTIIKNNEELLKHELGGSYYNQLVRAFCYD